MSRKTKQNKKQNTAVWWNDYVKFNHINNVYYVAYTLAGGVVKTSGCRILIQQIIFFTYIHTVICILNYKAPVSIVLLSPKLYVRINHHGHKLERITRQQIDCSQIYYLVTDITVCN